MYRWWRSDDERHIYIARYGLPSILAICLALILLPAAQGSEMQIRQQNTAADDQRKPPEYTFSVETSLVLLDVLVTDEDGNVLSGLKKGNFRILDEGKAQPISYFAPTEDPITIVILMEYSGLAYDYFAYKAAYWGSGFLRHLDGKDWIALITYGMKPTIQVDFTRNKTEVQDALNKLSYPGFNEANLFDAVVDTLEKLERVKGKKAILLITTGIDTFSKARLDDTLDKLKKTNVTVFCVGVAESEYMMAENRTGCPQSVIYSPRTNCRRLQTSPAVWHGFRALKERCLTCSGAL